MDEAAGRERLRLAALLESAGTSRHRAGLRDDRRDGCGRGHGHGDALGMLHLGTGGLLGRLDPVDGGDLGGLAGGDGVDNRADGFPQHPHEEEDDGEEDDGEEDEDEEEEMGEEVDDYQTTEALEEIENDRENEEIDEEQEYGASSIGYEDTNGSSSSFAAYTDQDSNQKSQK